jgi:hypothetical protein
MLIFQSLENGIEGFRIPDDVAHATHPNAPRSENQIAIKFLEYRNQRLNHFPRLGGTLNHHSALEIPFHIESVGFADPDNDSSNNWKIGEELAAGFGRKSAEFFIGCSDVPINGLIEKQQIGRDVGPKPEAIRNFKQLAE